MMIDLEGVAIQVHETSISKGFWEPNNPDTHVIFYLKQLAMIHSEVSEVLEAVRKEKGEEAIVEEMADTLIRLLDLYEGMRRDGAVRTKLTDALMSKMNVNTDRPKMHGVLA